jgi:hypothetical protein
MTWTDTVAEDACYELYHESSKIGRRVRPQPLARPVQNDGRERNDEAYPLFAVGEADPAAYPIAALIGKAAARSPSGHLTMRLLATLLAAPAADQELIATHFHVRAVDGLPAGLYRLGTRGQARLFRRGDLRKELSATLLSPELGGTPLQIVLAGAFAVAAATSGERGYRRVLLAAGARAEMVSVTAAALGLAVATATEFYDRELDGLLGLDGIDAGALAVIAVGGAGPG